MDTDLIDGYLRHLRDINRAPNTIEARRLMLRRFDRELPNGLEVANEDELREVIYRDGWVPRTQATHLAGVRGFFRWACRHELDYDPTAELVRPKFHEGLPRPFADAQLADLLERTEEPYRLHLKLSAYGGLRACEIAAADVADVSRTGILVHGKGGKERIVPTHPVVWAAVMDLPPGPLARRRDDVSRRTTAHRVSRNAAAHFDKLGHPDATLHRGRHWYATKALEACDNLRTVQELLGHASPSSTAIYTMVTDKARRAAVEALPVFNGPVAA